MHRLTLELIDAVPVVRYHAANGRRVDIDLWLWYLHGFKVEFLASQIAVVAPPSEVAETLALWKSQDLYA